MALTVVFWQGATFVLLAFSLLLLYLYYRQRQQILSINDAILTFISGPIKKPGGGEGTLVVFSSKTCPACISFSSVWSELEKRYPGRTKRFEAEDNMQAMIDNNIKAFPTLRYYREGYSAGAEAPEFEGARTLDNIETFMRNCK